MSAVMKTDAVVAPFQSRAKRIVASLEQWDWSTLRAFLATRSAPIDIDTHLREYKRFLALAVANPHIVIPITTQVDDIWHAHILCTRDYAALCKSCLGVVLHHEPEPAAKSDPRPVDTNMSLYRAEFGEPTTSNDWACCCGVNAA